MTNPATRAPVRFDIAITKKWPGEKLRHGDPRWKEHTASFHKEQHTIGSLVRRVCGDGYAFSAGSLNGHVHLHPEFFVTGHRTVELVLAGFEIDLQLGFLAGVEQRRLLLDAILDR